MTKKLLITGLAVILLAGFAQAATLNLTGTVTNAYLPNTNTAAPLDITINPGVSYDYWVKFYFTVSDLGTEAGFGNLSMDLTLNGVDRVTGPTSPDKTKWMPNNPLWVDEDEGPQLTYADTGDVGNDFKAILAGLDVSNIPYDGNDPRGTLGQSTPAYFGSVRVNWAGVSVATLDITGAFSTFSGGQLHYVGAANGSSIQFGLIPEPATMSLLALGGLATLIRRRK